MPRRAGRPAAGSGRAPGKVGRAGARGGCGGEGGHGHPPPGPLGGPSGPAPPPPPAPRGARRASPLPLGRRPATRSGAAARGERARPRGRGAGRRPGPSRAAGEDPRGRARRAAAAPGGCRCGGRGRRRPAGSWREHGAQPRVAARAGPLPWFQTTAPAGAPLPLLHAQLAERRMTARPGSWCRGCPVELFSKGWHWLDFIKGLFQP